MAARVRNPIVVLGPDGKPLASASVQTNLRPSGTAASVFAAETGGTAGSNPATTDEHGRVTQWLARGAYSSVISATGLTTYSEAWDAVPGGDGTIDEAALEAVIQNVLNEAPSFLEDTHAKRPAANLLRLFRETDTGAFYISDGTAWHTLSVPGEIKMYAGSAAPDGWLKCEGQAVSRTTYKALFTQIGTAFGSGDGSTTFNVPDYRERTPVGVGAGTALASKGGEAAHALTIAELASHDHDVVGYDPAVGAAIGNNGFFAGINGSNAGPHSPTPKTGTRGTGTAHNNREPFTVCNFIIKA